MISNILINGVSVNLSGKRLINSLAGTSSPQIEVTGFGRSGGDGVALSQPAYRNFSLSFGVLISGSSQSDLVTQKQRFLSLLSVDPSISSSARQTFTFVTAAGEQLRCDAVVTSIDQQIAPADYNTAQVLVQLQSERSYFSGTSKTASLGIANLGGLTLPMNIPTAMNLNASAQLYTSLNNAGNAYAHLTATIAGPCSGFILLNYTRSLRLQCTQTLSATDSLALDFYQHTAILNSATNILQTVSGTWWTVAPGINSILFAANDTTAATSATLNYADAYLGI